MKRNIFTDAKKIDWRDVVTAVIIGLALAVLALSYFDVLTK